MSGGAWNYQQYKIEEKTEELAKLLKAVAQTEHIVDWAISCDTTREDAARELFDLWVKTFNELYD